MAQMTSILRPVVCGVALSLAVMVVINCLPTHAEADELRYGRWDEWCPINCNYEVRGKYGLVTDILMAVVADNGHTFQTVFVPEKRKYEALAEDRTNIVTVTPSEAARLQNLIISEEPIMMLRRGVVKQKGSPRTYHTIEDFESISMGINLWPGWPQFLQDHIDRAKKVGKAVELSGENIYARGVEMVKRKRIDVFYGTLMSLKYYAKVSGFDDAVEIEHSRLQSEIPFYTAFHGDNPNARAYAEMLSNGIRKLRKSGRLTEILEPYGLEDWKAGN